MSESSRNSVMPLCLTTQIYAMTIDDNDDDKFRV